MDFMKYCNIEEYHNKGFKGQNIVFLNGEGNTEHCALVLKTFKTIAPLGITLNGNIGCRCVNGVVSDVKINVNGTMHDLLTYLVDNNVKIMSASLSSEAVSEPFNIWIRENIIDKLGIIVLSPAGNCGNHICGIYKYCGIVTGACYYHCGEIIRADYSGQGELLNFVTFTPDGCKSGTSISTPCLAGQVALLLSKYGDMNQYQMFNLLKDNCEDLGNAGKDNSYGYGLPILPLGDINMSRFKDIENHWAKEDIERCVQAGIMNGYPDGTFQPDKTVTRAELAVIINRAGLCNIPNSIL